MNKNPVACISHVVLMITKLSACVDSIIGNCGSIGLTKSYRLIVKETNVVFMLLRKKKAFFII